MISSKDGKEDEEYTNDDDHDNDFLVILFRSPMQHQLQNVRRNLTTSSVFGSSSSSSNSSTPTTDDDYDVDDDGECNSKNINRDYNHYHTGLSFLPNGPVNFPFLHD